MKTKFNYAVQIFDCDHDEVAHASTDMISVAVNFCKCGLGNTAIVVSNLTGEVLYEFEHGDCVYDFAIDLHRF